MYEGAVCLCTPAFAFAQGSAGMTFTKQKDDGIIKRKVVGRRSLFSKEETDAEANRRYCL